MACGSLLSAGLAVGASSDFATDFSGATLDPLLTATQPGSTTVALDGSGHVNVFTGNTVADIWGGTFNGPTVRYAVDENDSHPFVLETEMTNYRDSGTGPYHAGLIMRFADRTVMWGPYAGGLIKHESDAGPQVGGGVPAADIRSIGGADINLKLRIVRSGTSYRLYFKRNSSVAGASLPDADWVLFNIVTHDPGAGRGPQWVGLFSKTWGLTDGDASFKSMRFSTADVPGMTGLFYGFNDGTFQGWQVISQGGGPNGLVAASESGRMTTTPCLTTAKTVVGGGFTGDSGHAPIIIRSPTFLITNAGMITWNTVGGNSATADPGTGSGPYPGGAMGVALVEANTGNRVLSDRLTQTGDLTSKMFDVTSLANNGIPYYLEAVDNFSGGWGYAEWDNFSIPGEVVPTLVYNFNDGTLQDWRVIAQGGGPNALATTSWNNLLGADPCLTTSRSVAGGIFMGDDPHAPIVVRSPTFTINPGATLITWNTVAGNCCATADPGTGMEAYPDGALGVVFVDASSGYRLLSDRLNQEGVPARKSFDVSSYAGNGMTYYLEVVDNFSGGWGYGEWDDFTIPGSLLPAPRMQVQSGGNPILFGGSAPMEYVAPGASLERQYTILNLPAAADPLTLSGNPVVGLSGDPQFTLSSDVPAGETLLAPGASTTFTIGFAPSTPGVYTAQISIDNNDPYKNPYTFAITVTVALRYTFDNGAGQADWQGWTVISQNGGDPKILVAACSERDYMVNRPCITTRSGSACGVFQGDAAHAPLIARSPLFQITGSQITFESAGGNLGAAAPNLGTGAYDGQVMGVALVRASDGTRVASVMTGSQDVAPTMRVNALDTAAYANDGNSYYLEAVDTFGGGWGFIEWDSFTIMGTAVTAPQMQVQSGTSTIGVGGSSAMGYATPGSTLQRVFVITNLPSALGNLELSGSPVVQWSGAPQLTLSRGVPAGETILPPGAGTSFTISFAPTNYGSVTGLVTIANNDPYKNPYTFTITARSVPVAYYTFDNAAAPWEDSSGNGNHITGNGGTSPTWSATGGFNNSASYSFNNARLIAPVDADIDAMPRMTWGAWVRTDVLSGFCKFLGTDDGCGDRTVGLDPRGDGWADMGGYRYTSFTGCGGPINNPLNGFAPVNTTDWAFVAVTYDQAATTATIYVDVNAATTDDPLAVYAKTTSAFDGTWHANIGIGSINPDGQGEVWLGAVDQVFIFDDVLDPAAITAIRDAGTAMATLMPPTPGPVRITALDPTTGDVTVTFASVPGHIYALRYKESLRDAEWTDAFVGDQTATDTTLSITDFGATLLSPQRFYRAFTVR